MPTCHCEERSDEAIHLNDQLDRHVAFCSSLMNTGFVITSPALPGVVIQLDGHGAKRLAMTGSWFIALVTQGAAPWFQLSP